MNYDISRDLVMPYLQAMQRISGDTASEKLSWIGRLASNQQEDIQKFDQLPLELRSILKVEFAVKNKQYEDVTSALKSDDSTIVTRALKASWFFDGSHEIVDAAYFRERVFPHVSPRTRIRIVKTLARKLKNVEFAQEIFAAVESANGFQIALPLLMACNEDFAYETIVKKKLILPVQIFHKIFSRNVNLGARLLKLFTCNFFEYASVSDCNAVNGLKFISRTYKFLFMKLLEERPLDFVDIIEKVGYHPEFCLDVYILSNKCAERLLNEAQDRIARNPHLYIHFLPPKITNKKQIEMMLPGLMKYACRNGFHTDFVLEYLMNYPVMKKLDLLRETYRDLYHKEFLIPTNITPALLRLLPLKQRIKVAKKMMKFRPSHNAMAYETAWICYFPLHRSIIYLKFLINEFSEIQDKRGYALQMIYTCKVNQDDLALYNVLQYVIDQRYIEDNDREIFEQMLCHVAKICKIPHLDRRNASLVFGIIQLFYEKFGYVKQHLLEDMLHFRLIQNLSITDLIDMLLMMDNSMPITFNMLLNYPHYERQCLLAFTDIFESRFHQLQMQQKEKEELEEQEIEEEKKAEAQREEEKALEEQQEVEQQNELKDCDAKMLCRLIGSIYNFNDRLKRLLQTKVKPITIKDYPWLMDAVIALKNSVGESYFYKKTESTLWMFEEQFYRIWLSSSTSKKIASVSSGAALRLLKRESQSILDNWEEYLMDCMCNYRKKHVQHFVRATRWYKDIPIKFAERCLDYLHGNDTSKKPFAWIILSLLLHGDTWSKLIDSFSLKIDDTNCSDVKDVNNFQRALCFGIKLSNPPVSLESISKFSYEDYFPVGQMAITNVNRRSSLSRIMLFAEKLSKMELSLREHWIQLMYKTAPANICKEFLGKMWRVDTDYAIRSHLYETILMLFRKHQTQEIWRLLVEVHSMFTIKDAVLLPKMYPYCKSSEYIEKYFDLWLNTIAHLSKSGLNSQLIDEHTSFCLFHLCHCKSLPAHYVETVLQNFLFHVDTDISAAMQRYTLTQLWQENYTTFLKVFTDILPNAVINQWNVSHPDNPYFYPTRCVMHQFLNEFAFNYIMLCSKDSFDPRVIDNVLNIFSTVLSPMQDAKSYLLLIYAKTLQECRTEARTLVAQYLLGLKLCNLMPKLVNIFSSFLIPFMAEVLDYFVKRIPELDTPSAINNIVEGFMHTNDAYGCHMAVTMLSLRNERTEYKILVKIFEKFAVAQMLKNTSVASILCDYLNKIEF